MPDRPASDIGEIEVTPEMVDAAMRVIDEQMESDGYLGRIGLRSVVVELLQQALRASPHYSLSQHDNRLLALLRPPSAATNWRSGF